jgi:hypothetical protein
VGTQAILVDEQDWPIAKTAHPLDHPDIDASLLRGQVPLVDASLVMQTERVRQTGGYDPAFEPAEGFEFLLRLSEKGRVANMAEHLYRYRMHAGQVTVARYERQEEAMREALAASSTRRGGRAVPPGPYVHRRTSQAWQTHVVWAEQALRFGYRRSAIKHSRLAVTRRPWSRTAWRVLLRALAPASPSSPGPQSAAT